MRCREYYLPPTLAVCCAILAEHGQRAAIVAGGTDVMVDARAGKARYADVEFLVDVTRVPELGVLQARGDVLEIGAGVTHARLAEDAFIRERMPFLAEACASVGSPQIRNRATIGGNLMTGSPAADGVVPLFALGAEAVFLSGRGKRTLPLPWTLTGPYRTCREPDEILTGFLVPVPPAGSRTAFLKIGRRKSLAIARMNLAVMGRKNADGRVDFVRLVPGAVLPVAGRLEVVERFLTGRLPDLPLLREAGRLAAEEMILAGGRRWSTPYKEPVLAALVRRALCNVLEVADVC